MDFSFIAKYEGMDTAKACQAIAKATPVIKYKNPSLAARISAIVVAIFSFGLALLFERWRLACQGFSSIKLDAAFFMAVAKHLKLDFMNNPLRTIEDFGVDRVKKIVQDEYRNRYFSGKNQLPYHLY